MNRFDWRRSRFDEAGHEPLGPLSNLVDIMLVFVCGLIAALASQQDAGPRGGETVTGGREVPELPRGIGEAGSGYESVGEVYRDPQTGKLILVGPASH